MWRLPASIFFGLMISILIFALGAIIDTMALSLTNGIMANRLALDWLITWALAALVICCLLPEKWNE